MTSTCKIYGQIPSTQNAKNFNSNIESISNISQMGESSGFYGGLVYYNHLSFDPWIVTSNVIQNTKKYVPLVAMQPNTMPPHTAAKIIQSIAMVYKRKVDLNIITGAKHDEMKQTGENFSHDEKYHRAQEYVEVLKLIFGSHKSVNFMGKYYNYSNLEMGPALEKEFLPDFFVAGASNAGIILANKINGIALTHPGPINDYMRFIKSESGITCNFGIRLTIIARETSDEAWAVAKHRYPINRLGLIQNAFKKNSESQWIRTMASLADNSEIYDDVYWMGAYYNGHVTTPVLVGDYFQVADYLCKYIEQGISALLLGYCFNSDDFEHTKIVIKELESKSRSLKQYSKQ